MSKGGPDWEALRRAYAPALGGGAGSAGVGSAPDPAQPPSAAQDRAALALDLAEERAAIMEYCGGLSRKEAEALAFRRAIAESW